MSTSTDGHAFLPLGLVEEHLARIEGLLVVRKGLVDRGLAAELVAIDRRQRAPIAGLRARATEAVKVARVRLHSPFVFEACAAALALLDLAPSEVRTEDGGWRARPAVAELLDQLYLVPTTNDDPSALAATSPTLRLPRIRPLPFHDGQGTPSTMSVPSPRPLTPPRVGGDTTSVTTVPPRRPIPFPPSTEAERQNGETVETSVLSIPPNAPARRAPAPFAETATVPHIPSGPVLPFANEALALRAAQRAARERLGATALVPTLPRQPTLPFSVTPSPASLPALFPLAAHAALCAELAFAPSQANGILERHGLTPEARSALDDHYRKVVADNAELRVAWNRAYQDHYQHIARLASGAGRA